MQEYFLEVAKMDVENVVVLKRKSILKSFPTPENVDKLKSGFIEKDLWGVACMMKENETVKSSMLFLRDKNLYFTTTLSQILA